MEESNEEKSYKKYNQFLNYHCKKCKELPSLLFGEYYFDLICSKHKIIYIPIEQIYNYIIFDDYNCFICKQSSNSNNFIYCYECNNYYCSNCLNRHNQEINKCHHTIKVNNMNTMCKIHNKNYNKYCLTCKLNLCELCENHNNHYVELFKDIYPIKDDINKFKEICSKEIYDIENGILKLEGEESDNNTNENNDNNDSNDSNDNNDKNESIDNNDSKDYNEEKEENKNNNIINKKFKEISKKEKEKIKKDEIIEFIKAISLFIESFSKNITNYFYINNINNIIRCPNLLENTKHFNINLKKKSYKISNKDIYNKDIEVKNDINSIDNKIVMKTVLNDFSKNDYFYDYEVWCMEKLNLIEINPQKKLELIAMGDSNNKVILLNLLNFKLYQIIDEHNGNVYSLEQYKDDPKYLFSSSDDETINIYELDNHYKYQLIQKLKKSAEKSGSEMNKIIALSNKLLVSADRRSITIWKQNNKNENKINYEDFYEIIINLDTCQLLEVNPSIFVATQYKNLGNIQVYKNDGESFPLIGELSNIKTHGNTSNGIAKIDDNLVCCNSYDIINIISIEPLQIIQKILINNEDDYVYSPKYIYITKDNYLYVNGYERIIQYKIKKDENNYFNELIENGNYINENLNRNAIAPLDDGRVFYLVSKNRQYFCELLC